MHVSVTPFPWSFLSSPVKLTDISSSLYGITVLQTFEYYEENPEDHWSLKGIVSVRLCRFVELQTNSLSDIQVGLLLCEPMMPFKPTD